MIVKSKLKANFTVISNEIIRSKDLSNNAKLCAIILASLPSEWKANTAHLSSELGISIRATQRALKELVDLGFIKKVQEIEKENGKFSKFFSIFFINSSEELICEELEQESDKIEAKEEVKQDKSLNEADLNESSQEIELKNSTSSQTTNSRQADFCRTYKIKKFLQSKNLFLLRNFNQDIFLLFEKKQKESKPLNYFALNDFEKAKLDEFFKYKAECKKKLTKTSKQKIIRQCNEFKANGENIGLIIDKSIRNGWAGLFASKSNSKPKTKLSFELENKEILKRVLEQVPNFNFSSSFDLSHINIEGKKVSYDEKKDTFRLY